MNAYYRIRGIIVALFGGYILLAAIYGVGATAVRGFSSHVWRWATFGDSIGHSYPHFSPGWEQWELGTIWMTPSVLVAVVVGIGLVRQGLRAIASSA